MKNKQHTTDSNCTYSILHVTIQQINVIHWEEMTNERSAVQYKSFASHEIPQEHLGRADHGSELLSYTRRVPERENSDWKERDRLSLSLSLQKKRVVDLFQKLQLPQHRLKVSSKLEKKKRRAVCTVQEG